MIPVRELNAVCELSNGTLTIQENRPVFSGESGALRVIIKLQKDGTDYTPDNDVLGEMYLYYPNTPYMTEVTSLTLT